MKNVAVLKKDGAFALFFRPHPGRFDSSRVPTPGSLLSKAKKNAYARGSAKEGGGRCWAQLELTDALGHPLFFLFLRLPSNAFPYIGSVGRIEKKNLKKQITRSLGIVGPGTPGRR